MLAQTAIGELLERIEQIDEGKLWYEVAESEEAQEAVAEAQREQLRKGQRPDGSEFDYYSRVSQDLFGKPDEPIKWYDSGYFHDNIETIVRDNEIDFEEATTIGEAGETINLEQQYNETILGIQTDNFTDINEVFAAKYIEQLEILLGISG
jgi:hypothetical protein